MTAGLAAWDLGLMAAPDRDTALPRASLFIFQLERFCFLWKLRGERFEEDPAISALADSLWLALHPPERPARPADGRVGIGSED